MQAMRIQNWMKTLAATLRGVDDALGYAVASNDHESAAILRAVGKGLIEPPWAFMSNIEGWDAEVARHASLANAVTDTSIEEDVVDDLTASFWGRAERELAGRQQPGEVAP